MKLTKNYFFSKANQSKITSHNYIYTYNYDRS